MWKWFFYAVGLGLLCCAGLIRCESQPATYHNTAPSVAYTGIASCQPCHKRIHAAFVQTGMGRSLYRPNSEEKIERFGPDVRVYDAKRNFYYHPFWRGDSLNILEFRLEGMDTVFQRIERVNYIIGSGNQTRSYLMERNDYWYEMPITWFVKRQIWDLSPGYEEYNSRFSREIGQECLACHTGNFEFVPGSKNRYRNVDLGIACEQCHGPGERHIAGIKGGQLIDVGEEIDYTIVNPGKLSPQAQFDVCQQCHLQGIQVYASGKEVRDFRPSQRLHEAYSVFLPQEGDEQAFGIASHAERLQKSACFTRSAGQLTCITCHDPHHPLEAQPAEGYRQSCETCHRRQQVGPCATPEGMLEQSDCIACHMPQGGTKDIPHVSFHDHFIRVVDSGPSRPEEALDAYLDLHCATQDSPQAALQGIAWLRYFEQVSPLPKALAQADSLLKDHPSLDRIRVAFYQNKLDQAREYVMALADEAAQDAAYWFLRGEIMEARGEYAAAQQAYGQAYSISPESHIARVKQATTLLQAQPGSSQALSQARTWLEPWARQRPFDPQILSNLGFVVLNQGQLALAERYLRQALDLDPDYPSALQNLVLCYLNQGKRKAALARFEHLKQKHPQHPGISVLKEQLRL